MERGDNCRSSRLMMTVLWQGCESRGDRVLRCLCPGRAFLSMECLWGVSRSGSRPRGRCGSEMLFRGRFW